MNYQEQHIQLDLSGSDSRNMAYNTYVQLSFSTKDVLNCLEKAGILELANEIKAEKVEAVYLENNLKIETDTQEILFPIFWELILQGKVKIYDLENKAEVKEVIHVSINDVSGEQEYFKLKNGTIFLSLIKTLGE